MFAFNDANSEFPLDGQRFGVGRLAVSLLRCKFLDSRMEVLEKYSTVAASCSEYSNPVVLSAHHHLEYDAFKCLQLQLNWIAKIKSRLSSGSVCFGMDVFGSFTFCRVSLAWADRVVLDQYDRVASSHCLHVQQCDNARRIDRTC